MPEIARIPALAGAGPLRPLIDASVLMARRAAYEDRPPARPFRNPFASSDPMAKYRAITGVKARVRWWQRILSLAALAVLVVIMGALLAGVVGLLFFAARIILELLVG